MSKISRQTIGERTTAALRRNILSNRISPGTPITEDAMAEEFGVSRTTMRQVLNTLQMEGLLTRNPNTRILQVTTLTPDDVRDIYTARRFLELGGIESAADANAHQRQELEDALGELRRAAVSDQPEDFVDADFLCHAAIVSFLGSEHLSESHRLLMSKLRLQLSQVTDDAQDNLESLEIHERFTKHILDGRICEAKADLAERLDESERLVLERSAESTQPR